MVFRIDQGVKVSRTRSILIAGRDLLLGKVIEREGWVSVKTCSGR